MIRLILSIVLILILIVYTFVDVIINFIVSLFGKKYLRMYYHNVVIIFLKTLLLISGVKIKVFNENNIRYVQELVKKGEPVVIVSNHRSDYDIVIGYSLFDIPCGIVSKDNLLKVPILSYWMKKINCIFLNRDDIRSGIQMIIQAIKSIEKGIPIWIFPEGTRNKEEEQTSLLEFRAGAFKIASKTNAYICPVAFYKTDEIFEKHKPFIISCKIGISFGKVYRYDSLNDENRVSISEYTKSIISDMLLKLKESDDAKAN